MLPFEVPLRYLFFLVFWADLAVCAVLVKTGLRTADPELAKGCMWYHMRP